MALLRDAAVLQLFLANELEEELQGYMENINRRQLRDASNPFEQTNKSFLKDYRLCKEGATQLIELLRPHVATNQRAQGISLELKVLTALHFFGHGSYQRCVGNHLKFGIERSRVSRIVTEIIDCMVDVLLSNWVVFPQTEGGRNLIKTRFAEKYNFPGIIGAIDCTHIAITAPPTEDPVRPGVVYYNRKGYYSLNTQIICDANLKILSCNARFPGSAHDSAIWQLSLARQKLETLYLAGELRSSWLIGDSGYGLQPWLLTPIEDAIENTPEATYTRAHISARNTIERCFGVLKHRFRCLLKHRTLHYSPLRAGKIVYSCAILHNMCIHFNNNYVPDDEEVLNEAENELHDNNYAVDNNVNWLAEGRRIRNRVVQTYFNVN